MSKSNVPDKQVPKYTFHFEFDEIGLAMEQMQYKQLMNWLDWLSTYFIGEKVCSPLQKLLKLQYRRFRPSVGPKSDPKAWWRFACMSVLTALASPLVDNAVLADLQEKKSKWTWQYMSKRREMFKNYLALYKKKKKGQVSG